MKKTFKILLSVLTLELLNISIKSPYVSAFNIGNLEGRKIYLPWWILVLIIANIALLIWLFLPIRKKTPKNTKISKKGLDKKGRSR